MLSVGNGSKLPSLRLVAKAGAVALTLILSAVPTMACLLPTVTLTAAEHECCKRMGNQCGRAGMPSSHSCCRRLTGAEATAFITASSARLDHVSDVSYHISPLAASFPVSGVPPVPPHSDLGVHGPPGSPPATISVLRI